MAKLIWDAVGEKFFEAGIDHCVLYPVNAQGEYKPGVAWNGITSIAETPEGAEPQDQYADNIKYISILSAEELGGTIEAYYYPDEWNQCDGNAEISKGVVIGQQNRKAFGLSYRTKIGNDVEGQDLGYKLHLLYGAKASPSERTFETINDSPEPSALSWEYTTTPVPVEDHNPTALLTIDSTKVDATKLAALEKILYGSDEEGAEDPRLPLPNEVMSILAGATDTEVAAARMSSMVRESY